VKRVDDAALRLSQTSADGLYNSLGRGDVSVGQVLKAMFPEREEERLEAPKPTAFGRVLDRIRVGRGVRVHGVDGLMVRYAQCCQPVPGDSVVGYVTKGRGISIHRADCPNLLTMPNDTDRRVDIDWQSTGGEVFVVCLGLHGEDRRGLYAEIMESVSQTGTNIRSAELWSKDGTMSGSVLVEVENNAHLAKVVRALRHVKGVDSVERKEPSVSTASRGSA
jgi:GTP pyrophosphokinase